MLIKFNPDSVPEDVLVKLFYKPEPTTCVHTHKYTLKCILPEFFREIPSGFIQAMSQVDVEEVPPIPVRKPDANFSLLLLLLSVIHEDLIHLLSGRPDF